MLIDQAAKPSPRQPMKIAHFCPSTVIPRVQQDIASIKDGDSVSVEWIPADNFKFPYRFMGDDEESPTDLPDRVAL